MKKYIALKKIISVFGAMLLVISSCASVVATSYGEYSAVTSLKPIGKDKIVISAESAIGKVKFLKNNNGLSGTSVLFEAETEVVFPFTISCEGRYRISFTYYTGVGTGAPVTRNLLLDGVLPFSESAEITLPQLWQDDKDVSASFDALGNQNRAKQVRKKEWRTEYASDSSGRNSGALLYFMTSGEHKITLSGGTETLLLYSITIEKQEEIPSYSEMQAEYQTQKYKSALQPIFLEAEKNCVKSDNTMRALSDKTSPSVSPYSASKVVYNTIGGTQWKLAGQWIEWEIKASESALYQIGFHFKQADKVGDVSVRELYIDGALPFKESADLQFDYDGAWQFTYLSDNTTPYLFYLTKGIHKLRLKVGLGSTAKSITEANECLASLNSIYRKIVVITGSSPDQYRDYHLDTTIPKAFLDMKTVNNRLKALEKSISGKTSGSQSTAAIKRICLQLDEMIKDSDQTAILLSSFQDNISSFGTWITSRTEQPLTLDTIVLSGIGGEKYQGEAKFGSMILHYVKQFLYSFITDYTSIGVTKKTSDKKIKVWLASGRDQSQILKQLINDSFTVNTGIAVNLQLVTASALLPSIISGTVPDVYMGMPQADPINLALRDALCDLSKFSDFLTISQRFNDQALIPFKFQDGVYALPDTMAYNMLFCRSDIIKELGININQLTTWDSVLKDILPELQVNSLSFGIPVALNSYLTFLYQNGGEVYTNNGKKSALSSTTAISCMDTFSKMYTQYGLPLSYDFANRFRSGEMPLAIADYLLYNQLTVFAPEIKGLWTMLPVPGTRQNNGKINMTTPITVTGSVILSKCKDKEAAWEYLKWWSSSDVQQEYGAELESVVGAAARYNSANMEAVGLTQWKSDMKRSLTQQMKSLRAYPEVPGGYLTMRYYDFAFRDIVYNGEKVRDTMIDSVDSINSEIAHKRSEYNLD